MKRLCLFFLFVYLFVLAAPAAGPDALAAEKSLLTGKVSDAAGRPVEGAMVFVYANASVRRSADFMSPPTDSDGVYRVFLPAGRYWAVARLKKTEGVGPLMPGDKHSGDPVEVDLTSENETGVDFTVADLKEAVGMRQKPREGSVKITGRITDEKGAPLVGVYAVVCRRKELSGMPDYLSAWVDDDGRYILYIPKGKYYLGSASAFPPGETYLMNGEIKADGDRSGVDIVRKTTESR
ncbi:MAG: carboxypeptidase-like regulatory domain-containing protein [Nitrospiraceae bacterium]|nr:carboxypeptidase-like regulatory domain-containing protein [Nitrospiraceae bacterium]